MLYLSHLRSQRFLQLIFLSPLENSFERSRMETQGCGPRNARWDPLTWLHVHACVGLRFSCQQQMISIAYARSRLLAWYFYIICFIYNYHKSDLMPRWTNKRTNNLNNNIARLNFLITYLLRQVITCLMNYL